MATLTAKDFANQMVAQARMLDPSISLEIGTPERKLVDTVASTLAENQVDLTGLASALEIDAKFGSNLDRFTGLFGFERQQSTAATGYVVFSRNTPAPETITIPTNIVVQSTTNLGLTNVQYTTTANGQITVGTTQSGAVPIRCVIEGTFGNTSANTITMMIGTLPPGVTAVTNLAALTNGIDSEDDNSYKARFKNTWARNLAGTQDQYLALALATAVTTKANVVGAQSRFLEYFQVPDDDDAGYLNGTLTGAEVTYGVQNQWTTAQSTIPYAKQIYTSVPAFLSTTIDTSEASQKDSVPFFYRQGTDFTFNYPPTLTGDTLRESATTTVTSVVSSTINVTSTAGFLSSGSLIGRGSSTPPYSAVTINYTGKTTTSFTGCSGTLTSIAASDEIYAVPPSTVQPNFTFLNVFSSSTTQIAGLQAVAPGDVALGEFSYVSSASRNDMVHGVTNAVDVFVDGANDIAASTIFLPSFGSYQFVLDSSSPWYYENYRRDGSPTKRPQLNNFITPLFQSPVDSLPASVTIKNQEFYLGVHYWLVHEVDQLVGSIRARDGIEWSSQLAGDLAGGADLPGTNNISPQAPYVPGGNTLVNLTGDGITPVEINNYQYDANIVTLQGSTEAAKQVTTDVLVHKAKQRYLKLDLTIVYSRNTNQATVNSTIATTVQNYFNRQFFGTVVELSTLLEIVHQVPGVENVRWTNDLPTPPNFIRVLECDATGTPAHGVSVDRWIFGNTSTKAVQTLYLAGNPNGVGDHFTLSWADTTLGVSFTTASISLYNTSTGAYVTAGAIQSAINTAAPGSGIYNGITVVEDVRPTTNVSTPIRSFSMTYGANGTVFLPAVTNTITSSSYAYDEDFYLRDDELPTLPIGQVTDDTLPGVILRQRAQNTLFRPGIG